MHALRRHVAQAMLVVMVVSSCPTAQAIDWDYWSECVRERQQQFSNQIKKHKVIISLMAGAAAVIIGGYIGLSIQAEAMIKNANQLLADADNRYEKAMKEHNFRHVDTNVLTQDIERLEASDNDLETRGWVRQFVGPGTYRTTREQLVERRMTLEGFQASANRYQTSTKQMNAALKEGGSMIRLPE